MVECSPETDEVPKQSKANFKANDWAMVMPRNMVCTYYGSLTEGVDPDKSLLPQIDALDPRKIDEAIKTVLGSEADFRTIEKAFTFDHPDVRVEQIGVVSKDALKIPETQKIVHMHGREIPTELYRKLFEEDVEEKLGVSGRLVSKETGEKIGFFYREIVKTTDGKVTLFSNTFKVDEPYRGRGLQSGLTDRLVNFGKKFGFHSMHSSPSWIGNYTAAKTYDFPSSEYRKKEEEIWREADQSLHPESNAGVTAVLNRVGRRMRKFLKPGQSEDGGPKFLDQWKRELRVFMKEHDVQLEDEVIEALKHPWEFAELKCGKELSVPWWDPREGKGDKKELKGELGKAFLAYRAHAGRSGKEGYGQDWWAPEFLFDLEGAAMKHYEENRLRIDRNRESIQDKVRDALDRF